MAGRDGRAAARAGVLLLAAASLACGDDGKRPIRYAPAGGSFAVTFPASPEVQRREMNGADGVASVADYGSFKLTQRFFHWYTTVYFVRVIEYTKPVEAGNAEARLREAIRARFAELHSGNGRFQEPHAKGTVDYEIATEDGNRGRARALMSDGACIELGVFGPRQTWSEKRAEEFFSSLELKPARP